MIFTKSPYQPAISRLFVLLPLVLLFMTFNSTAASAINTGEVLTITDPIDAKAVEKEVAPYLKRLAADKNDSQALSFLNRTFVHLSYKYPNQKAELAEMVVSLVKKYEAPIVAALQEGSNNLMATLITE